MAQVLQKTQQFKTGTVFAKNAHTQTDDMQCSFFAPYKTRLSAGLKYLIS